MMHFKYKGPGPTRLYECEHYSVEAPPTSCWFCKHLTDVWFDYTNGPYSFLCVKGHSDPHQDENGMDLGMLGQCTDFEEAEE